MSENITFVSPRLFLSRNYDWKSSVWKPGFIPLLTSDVNKLQHNLELVLQRKRKQLDAQEELKLRLQLTEEISIGANIENIKGKVFEKPVEHDLDRYQPLKQFLPISVQQQIYTVCVKNVPNRFDNNKIEKLLDLISKTAADIINEVYQTSLESKGIIECWTTVSSSNLEFQNVMLRFKLQDIHSNFCAICIILQNFLKLFEKSKILNLELHYGANTTAFIKDHSIALESSVELAKRDELFKTKANEFRSSFENLLASPSSKLDKLNDHSSFEYHIDMNTLSDLPPDSLEQLSKDIVDFRTRVFTLEKEKRSKEVLEESRRRRQHVTSVLDQIKKTRETETNEFVTSHNDYSDSDSEDGNDNGLVDTPENDLAIWNHNLQMKKEESDRRYEDLLKLLRNKIVPDLQYYQTEIDKARDYEKALEQNRDLNLKDLLYSSTDIYYNYHRDFKETEIEQDRIDRELYKGRYPENKLNDNQLSDEDIDNHNKNTKEGEITNENFKIKLTFGKEKQHQKKAVESKPTEEDKLGSSKETETLIEPESTNNANNNMLFINTNNILPFDEDDLDERLQKLRKSNIVDELVKEYLGVYESELVDYIIDNIKENKDKNILLDELKQTFDEDAVIIVDKIWNRKEFE
ncbi:hypothetical protein TBLA_0E01220 [Henningerozyma blattae CBS 6284]|uniref:U1 small nuclear ribonucleoprotein component SNU71 n=1 Tax=Henningerozyma blattae (strain ATCC 34711 / CBS 6284 / DSM 70876 / NBRC 10599 / NRRL Y-10934 / UCD 77-7) TaxID=1071380 RepID=I2H480_HENB6|nr:hypothetical protein TBLA_0E01220 [Tetrapisispora blattae CBS 6284]CCH61182.1 hypothetical protein TBLA_0E01220 [Tetrapisispora blattae CBS 6284]